MGLVRRHPGARLPRCAGRSPHERKSQSARLRYRHMNADRFTIKSQEALAGRAILAEERRNPQVTPEHLLAVLLEQDGGVVAPGRCASSASTPRPCAARSTPRSTRCPTLGAGGEAAGPSSELVRVLRAAEHEMRELKDEYVSTEHLLLALAGHSRRPASVLRAPAPRRRRCCEAHRRGPRRPARVTDQNPEDKLPGAGEVRPRPDRRRAEEASSTRSSAATTRSAASSRCSAAARRTTRC